MRRALLSRGIHIKIKSNQGYFGVNYDSLSTREMNDGVGAQTAPFLVRMALLDFVFLPFAKTGSLQDRAKDHLSPRALGLRVAFKRPCEVGGFRCHSQARLCEVADLCGQRGALPGARRLRVRERCLKLADSFPRRCQDRVDLFLVLSTECCAVRPQRLVRK
jgi:hypothetical protein